MSFIVVLLVSLACAFIGRSLGKSRKIGATAGFLLGLFIGVLGLIIIALSPEIKASKESVQAPAVSATSTSKVVNNSVTSSKNIQVNNEVKQAIASDVNTAMDTDKSIIKKSNHIDVSFLDELALEVCLNGDSLEKYERIIDKKYGNATYDNLKRFVEEVRRSEQKGRYTNTSIANLGYLAKSVGLVDSTVKEIITKRSAAFIDKCPCCGRELNLIACPDTDSGDFICGDYVYRCLHCNRTISIPGTSRDPEIYQLCQEDPVINSSTGVLHFRGYCHGSVGIWYELSYESGAFREERALEYTDPEKMKRGCGGDNAHQEYTLRPMRTGLFTVYEDTIFRGELSKRIIHHILVDNDIES